jgi:hypothetical protein
MPSLVRRVLVGLLLVAIASDRASAEGAAAELPGTARLSGRIVGPDAKRAVGTARVLAYHLTSRHVFDSAPAKPNGDYEIRGLPFGYFDLAVETPEGLWLADRVVNLPPAGKLELTLTVGGASAPIGVPPGRVWPGGGALAPVGALQVRAAPRGRDFWRSPKGIALVTGIVAVTLLAIASSGNDSSSNASNP